MEVMPDSSKKSSPGTAGHAVFLPAVGPPGMQGRLGLQRAGGRNVVQQGDVNEAGVFAALLDAHLTGGVALRLPNLARVKRA